MILWHQVPQGRGFVDITICPCEGNRMEKNNNDDGGGEYLWSAYSDVSALHRLALASS